MLKVGLTGSIAVGKSYVCQVFKNLGALVLDADETAREVVKPYTEGWHKIVEAFGKDILQEDGSINRAKLGEIVFSDEKKRALLNSITHPLIIKAQNEWLRNCEISDPNAIAIIDAALMIESGSYKRFDKLIVVWCKPEIQLQRLMQRNKLSKQEALKRISTQMSQEEKKKYADFLIDTSDGFESTHKQVVQVFQKLKECVSKK
ncbi:MAG: dephospho-CoA kinase [Pyrinomonadaceae bacterium]|nr:dephospho-CoA kinase [Pyrinomonadaceae bacterium]MCX7640536.1 dephospho-CoA kinase [Pyrinomonadaceae bacterium]MDW8303883.1 dephospho-CoA kinase [Acidobacteriota bacterium]